MPGAPEDMWSPGYLPPGSRGNGGHARGVAFERITTDPDVMGGVPTVRGLRIPVATVVARVADGMTAAEIVDDLPDLTVEAASRQQPLAQAR